MPESRQLKVFLCHSSSDKPVVRELYQKLSAEGWIDPWLDEEKLFPGQDWNLEIEKAVEAADAILVCLSNNSITKEGYVQRELRIVLDYADYKPEGTLYIIPVRLEECEPPRRLRPWQYANYFPKEDRDKAYQHLLVSLRMRASGLGVEIPKSQKDPAQAPEPKQVETTKDVSRGDVGRELAPEGGAIPPHARPSREGTIVIGDMEFMLVPKGKFLMGSRDDDKDAYDDEKLQHTVEIPYDYWPARFTVTNEQYAAFVKAKKGEHPVSGWENKRDYPVVNVSWLDAMAYVQWLNEEMRPALQGDPRLAALVLRLPTEAEWEKAARGVYGNIYPWGNEFDKNRCNSYESGKMDTMPVNAFPNGASPYGCEQMSGNVWEWTHTLFEKYPYAPDTKRENESDQNGVRVVRGGSFIGNRQYVRMAVRFRDFPDYRGGNLGFRVILAPKLE